MTILDTNIFNRLLDGQLSIGDLPPGPYVATHIQLDELERTPDIGRRTELRKQFTSAIHAVAATESFVIGFSRIGMARLGDGNSLEQIRLELNTRFPKRAQANTNDALIGETSIKNGCTMVTADTGLAEVVRRLGGTVVEFH